MQNLKDAYRNADASAKIGYWGEQGRYRPASFQTNVMLHGRECGFDLLDLGIVERRTSSLIFTTYDENEHVLDHFLMAAASILNEDLPLTGGDTRCDRFVTEELNNSDHEPQFCVTDVSAPCDVNPYPLYGMLGMQEHETAKLTRRICEGLNRRQYRYGR
jgi:hypothetical protein